MEFGKANWRTFEQGIQKEWLLTNGIGGFASSTVIGANTRRYHGLLVASLRPPVSRHLLLSKIDENLTLNHEIYNLYSFQASDSFIAKGYHHLQRVTVDPLPTFFYSVRDVFIEKKICMVYGENTVVVVYRIRNGSDSAKLKLTPLVNFRDYHNNSASWHLKFDQKLYDKGVHLKPTCYDLNLNIYCSEGTYTKQNECYFFNMFYAAEQERGLQAAEDHYIPGYFEVDVKPYEDKTITMIATIEDKLNSTDGAALVKKEEERLGGLVRTSGLQDELAQRLVMAADHFIVHRKSTDSKTIIAGYPWFTDWGRDTMIALPGLTLATNRFQDARDILYTFSRYVKDGLIPNMFPDEGQEPIYNSVDGALWYFEAVNKYIEYTKDYEFIQKHIYDALKQIVEYFIRGTHFNIKMEEDSLLSAGEKGVQLTWMDAKIGDWIVTPREGKAVEINALWYNALKVMSRLSKEYGEDNKRYEELSKKIKKSFTEEFWNKDKQCLFDVINDGGKDGKVRPNQIIAISVSYPVLDGDKAKLVVDKVWKELYTAYGLRSLSPYSNEYVGIYSGDQYRRDSAYHQGTVWTWPLGHFITAYMKVNGYSKENKEKALCFIKPFRDHLNDACIGSVSEIFDGEEPLLPRGCFAQAWSVAEILRAYVEDLL